LEQNLEIAGIMKKIFTLFTVVAFTISAKAQTSISNTAKGEILNLAETQYDFGKIPQGKPVTHNFNVSDDGTDSLKISNIQASCGCTTPEWERGKIVAPGEKTKISVGYNAANEGTFVKLITITYNGSQTKQITIKGEVWKTPVSSAPENKDLDNLKNQ
jgi:hypothetical protein